MAEQDERTRSLVERGKATRFGQKRGPGRPPKQPVNDAGLDPRAAGAAAGTAAEPESAPASGRPADTGTRAGAPGAAGEKARPSLDLSSLAGVFIGMHEMAALRPGHEFWKLDLADEKQAHKVIGDVLRWYSIPATQKAIDHVALCVMLWRFETPRVVMESKIRKQERVARGGAAPPSAGMAAAAAASAKIFNFMPPGSQPTPVVPDIGEAVT